VSELVVPTVADASRIASVINARSLALGGETEESAEGVARWFAMPSLDPEVDMRLALSATGVMEGYGDVSGPEDDTPRAWIDLRVLPETPEALDLLLAWAQERGVERVGAGGKLQFSVDERDEALRCRLDDAGYTVVRSSYGMERSLDDAPEPPVWPPGIETRAFDERDAAVAHAAHEEAFADHWGYVPSSFEGWRAFHLGSTADPTLWRVAWDGDEIAGLCINAPRRGEDDTVGWVEVLAVRRSWRRRGLGAALLREAFATFADRGKRAVGLGVDAENTTGAVSLYKRAGMRVVRRSDQWERSA